MYRTSLFNLLQKLITRFSFQPNFPLRITCNGYYYLVKSLMCKRVRKAGISLDNAQICESELLRVLEADAKICKIVIFINSLCTAVD